MSPHEPTPDPVTIRVACPYCLDDAELVSGLQIYPRRADLSGKMFWRCEPCHAYVGCHPGSVRPLGRLADADLRRAKMAAHSAFDPLWKIGTRTRAEAYRWLAGQLGIPPEQCHIGAFDVDQCRKVVEVVRAL